MSAYQALDDASLIALVCQSNQTAFAELVRRHTDRFFALAYRTLGDQSDAEDIVQTAFIKLWQQRPDAWQAGRSKFTTWFYQIILNACRDFLRKHKRQTVTSSEIIESQSDAVESEQQLAEQRQGDKQRQAILHEGLRSLSASQRDAINLVVYCELPQRQAAEIMGISIKALESLLQRAKKRLDLFVEMNSAQGDSQEQHRNHQELSAAEVSYVERK